ncbi:hypothetical protein BH23GEM7_BH23GEM7_39530 [soil metagenome]
MTTGRWCIVTSVVRHAGQLDASGFVRVVDLDSRRVVMKSLLPEARHRASDPNPRGGLRGARGVAALPDRLVIANAERLFIVDSSWRRLGEITHPWFGGVHDILGEEEGIWVACTSADLLLKVDWEGRLLAEWEWRRDERLVEALGFLRLPPVDRRVDYRDPQSMRGGVRNTVHLNAVSRGTDGLLLSFGRILSPAAYRRRRLAATVGRLAVAAGIRGRRRPNSSGVAAHVGTTAGSSAALVQLREDGSAAMLKSIPGTSVPNHNVIQIGDALVYNDSNADNVVATWLDGRHPDRVVRIPGDPGFVRGLARLDGDTILVGSQAPAAIYLVNLRTGRVEAAIPLEGQSNESVYGIALIPPTFDPPPSRLDSAIR